MQARLLIDSLVVAAFIAAALWATWTLATGSPPAWPAIILGATVGAAGLALVRRSPKPVRP